MSKKTTITDVINIAASMGDNIHKQWEENKDLKVAQTALQAYSVAISGAKAQLIYKKMTGNPETIEFLKG